MCGTTVRQRRIPGVEHGTLQKLRKPVFGRPDAFQDMEVLESSDHRTWV